MYFTTAKLPAMCIYRCYSLRSTSLLHIPSQCSLCYVLMFFITQSIITLLTLSPIPSSN